MNHRKCLLLQAALLVAGIAMTIPSRAGANAGRLPSVALRSAAGATTDIGALSGQPRWLLIYVRSDAPLPAALAGYLERHRDGLMDGHIVLVIGGPAPGAVFQNAHRLMNLRWRQDIDHALEEPLNIKFSPTILAIEHDAITWRMAGLTGDPGAWPAILNGWLASPVVVAPAARMQTPVPAPPLKGPKAARRSLPSSVH